MEKIGFVTPTQEWPWFVIMNQSKHGWALQVVFFHIHFLQKERKIFHWHILQGVQMVLFIKEFNQTTIEI